MTAINRTIDLKYDTTVSFNGESALDDTVEWYLINSRNPNEAEPLQFDGRNADYDIPGLQWRSATLEIMNGDGDEPISDRAVTARSMKFQWGVNSENIDIVRGELNRIVSVLDRTAKPFYLYNNELNVIAEIERLRYNTSRAMIGTEMKAVNVTLEVKLLRGYYESARFENIDFSQQVTGATGEFDYQISGLSGEMDTLVATGHDYIVSNDCEEPVAPIFLLESFGFPTDFTIRNNTNNRAFRIIDTSFLDGAVMLVNCRTGQMQLTPAGSSTPIENSRSLAAGGMIQLEPGENEIRIETNVGVVVPDIYWKTKYAY